MIVALIALVILLVAAFLFGSIPFGYLIGRFFYHIDIRKQGSGNIGAMNALRTLGKTGAVAVLLLDALKGFIPVFLVGFVHGSLDIGGIGAQHVVLPLRDILQMLVGVCAVLGHCFSPWLGWRGGKGVATSFGVIFALSWKAGLICVAAWAIGALAVTQYSSVGSMLANLVSPVALWVVTGSIPYTIYGVFAGLFILYTHRENIVRLREGRENRISLLRKS
jgi:acyl phosphate:glycerol-3-phosphate acyltransferase